MEEHVAIEKLIFFFFSFFFFLTLQTRCNLLVIHCVYVIGTSGTALPRCLQRNWPLCRFSSSSYFYLVLLFFVLCFLVFDFVTSARISAQV